MKDSRTINLIFAKRSKKLPIVSSREEIKNIIDVIRNQKHKLIITLAYGAGLRISQVVNSKVKDANLEELTIDLKNAKGKRTESLFFRRKLKPMLKT